MCQKIKDRELLEMLEIENRRLNKLIEFDWLTQIYNRGTVENKINHILDLRQSGTLFALDVNRFKFINDCYGHLCGDNTLKEIGRKLYEIANENDIYGRIGGDEFVLFIPQTCDDAAVLEKENEIAQRMSEIKFGNQEHVSIAVCGSRYEGNDTYTDLFARADYKLLQKKRNQKIENRNTEQLSIYKDGALIREDLKEKNIQAGAFCQEYDSFKNIYRFMERYLCRSSQQVYLVLLTLIVNDSHNSQHDQETSIRFLKSSIQHVLRLGDVFTQYSSCQFLIMAMDTSEQGIERMVERIKSASYTADIDGGNKMILYHSFPLQAVKGKGS